MFFATVCSVASILGGLLGYCIGFSLWEAIGPWAMTHLGWAGLTPGNFQTFATLYNRYDFWVVFTCGFTPLPYKVCTISAGIAHIDLLGFVIASAISRSARFYLVAGLVGWKGQSTRAFIERYFNILSFAFVAILILGFAALKLAR
ncbi:MAG: VTT domain-containing protein [Sedimentisphaerales bacterium]|nr:VTT domain-containing protein [Sedimentisphaerales bacterium]